MNKRLIQTVILLASISIGYTHSLAHQKLPYLSYQATKEWSTEDHRKAADYLHEEAVQLQDQVAQLEQWMERVKIRRDRDMKGVKQRIWKNRLNAYRTEISELSEKIAWHNREADRLKGALPSEEKAQASQASKEWSAEEHREIADLLDEDVARLEAKVAHLEQRVERFNKKPYLDPTKIKRQEWKTLIKANLEEISELREQINWHYGEAERLSTILPSELSENNGENNRS